MPLCLCLVTPLLLIAACFYIPESPRWLIFDGQLEKAWKVLQRLHHDPNDARDTAAHAEFIQVEKQVVYDKGIKSGYVQMFTNPTWRKRSLLAILVIFAVQSAGINGVTTYLVVEVQATGLTGSMPLLIYCIYVVVAISVNFLNALVLDKVGRKKMLRKLPPLEHSDFLHTRFLYPMSDRVSVACFRLSCTSFATFLNIYKHALQQLQFTRQLLHKSNPRLLQPIRHLILTHSLQPLRSRILQHLHPRRLHAFHVAEPI